MEVSAVPLQYIVWLVNSSPERVLAEYWDASVSLEFVSERLNPAIQLMTFK
jgi:hypothetical protein